MTTPAAALPFRTDTLLGVCEGIGEEFGFHPNLLRLVFAVLLLCQPVAVIGAYLALGVVLAACRWWWPAAVATQALGEAAAPPANDAAVPALPLAA